MSHRSLASRFDNSKIKLSSLYPHSTPPPFLLYSEWRFTLCPSCPCLLHTRWDLLLCLHPQTSFQAGIPVTCKLSGQVCEWLCTYLNKIKASMFKIKSFCELKISWYFNSILAKSMNTEDLDCVVNQLCTLRQVIT